MAATFAAIANGMRSGSFATMDEKRISKRQRAIIDSTEVQEEKKGDDEAEDTMICIYFTVIIKHAMLSYVYEVVTTEEHLNKIDQLIDVLARRAYPTYKIMYLLQKKYDLSDWKSLTSDQFDRMCLKREHLTLMEQTLGEDDFKTYFIDKPPVFCVQKTAGYRPPGRYSTFRMISNF